jgi:hypothetical protein
LTIDSYLSKLDVGEAKGTRGLKNRVVVGRVLWLKVVVNEAKVGTALVELAKVGTGLVLEVRGCVVEGVVDLEVNPPNKTVRVVSGGFLVTKVSGGFLEAKVGIGTIEVVRTRPTIGSGWGNVLTD